MPENPDHFGRRCPRLGSPVLFAYCRITGEAGLPCFKIFDCWWEKFDVVSFLKEEMDPADFEKLTGFKPKPKVVSLVELIEKAKRRTEEG
ncbi:MAG: hypothetical protein AB1921_05795 [Thermodesulfobacteriota bacterium]